MRDHTAPLHALPPSMPMWPWVLLAVLVMLGVSMSRDRLTSLRVATVVPIVMLLVSLASVRTTFGLTPTTLGAWLAGTAIAACLVVAAGWPRGVTWNVEAHRLAVPGSWAPLALFIAIFASRFALGTIQAMHLPVMDDPLFAPGMSLLSGVFSGVFLGRGLVMQSVVPSGAGRLARSAAMAAPQPRP